MIPETEQWKLDGDCSKCRKDAYCDKECKARKKLVKAKLAEMLSNAFNKAVNKRAEEIAKEKEDGQDSTVLQGE